MEKITIDKTIEIFEGVKKGICPWYPEPYCDMAINTMRKYQKIKELYDYWRSGKCEYTISCMENIGKVLEDGGSEEEDNQE